jgi:hypothetical protein
MVAVQEGRVMAGSILRGWVGFRHSPWLLLLLTTALGGTAYAQAAADCQGGEKACVAECRAGTFAIDPRRAQCVASCSTRAGLCGKISETETPAQTGAIPRVVDQTSPAPRRRSVRAVSPSVRSVRTTLPPRRAVPEAQRQPRDTAPPNPLTGRGESSSAPGT